MTKAAILYTDGTMEVKDLTEFKQYQEAIGGWLTGVKLFTAMGDDYAYMYVDDEGLLKDLPQNSVAGGISFMMGNTPYLMGTAIVVGPADDEGYNIDIPESLLQFLTEHCGKREADGV